MEILWGAAFGAVTALAARVAGFDRDRSFYPTVMVVVALLYLLFACMATPPTAIVQESIPAALFIVAAILGFRKNLFFVVAALFGHGLFDLVHSHAIANPAVPVWWPGFCGAIDWVLAAALALAIRSRRIGPAPHSRPGDCA